MKIDRPSRACASISLSTADFKAISVQLSVQVQKIPKRAVKPAADDDLRNVMSPTGHPVPDTRQRNFHIGDPEVEKIDAMSLIPKADY
jgi:hypothetical protein